MYHSTNQTQKFIIKLFPEIMVKGNSAKREMVGQLYNNLIKLLNQFSQEIKIKKFSDKLEVVTPLAFVEATRTTLLNTSGIEQVLEALQFDNIQTLQEIKEKVYPIVKESLKDKTFVVRVKRSGKHDFNSTTIEQTLGGYLLAKSEAKNVDLHHPQITIRLELINHQLNLITKKYQGLAGFPLGTQGDILSLMSGGFDSTVASYLTIKRGIKTHFIFFNLGGIAHEIGVKQVAYYLWNKFGASHKVSFISVAFDEVIEEIFRSTHESYMGVTLKRLMLLASQEIAQNMNIDALVTGESVAQVSSQTLRNLALIDQATQMLILRPLATMNKPEIMKIASDIGTKHFAENMPEYCGVISKNPITHGSYKRMEKEAKRFNYDILQKAIQEATISPIDEVIEEINTLCPIEVVHTVEPTNILIDIRGEKECIEAECTVLSIPFHKLKTEFKTLDKNKEYLLYCEKGVMSQLHAQYLKDAQGFENVKVYRP